MEKASGELSLTVVTVLAVAALAAVITFITPSISNWIKGTFNSATGNGSANLNIPTN